MTLTTTELKAKAFASDVGFHLEKVGNIVVGCTYTSGGCVSYEVNGERANKKLVDILITKEIG